MQSALVKLPGPCPAGRRGEDSDPSALGISELMKNHSAVLVNTSLLSSGCAWTQ